MTETEKIISDYVDLRESVRDFTKTIDAFYNESNNLVMREILLAVMTSDKYIQMKEAAKIKHVVTL